MALKQLDSLAIRVINIGVRTFGVLACFVGVAFLLSAWFTQSDRILFGLIGALCIAMGIAIWMARPITQSQIDSLRERSGSDPGN
jgi:di/tricarboxylate transporter